MKNKQIKSKTIGIVGLGLIGGSLALDLKALGHNIVGITHRSSTALRAKARGLAQLVSTDPKMLKNCEIVILALPLRDLIQPDSELIRKLPSNSVLTDVGSVKAPVVKVWRELHPAFVPSHPMAGNHNEGVEAGTKNLFKGKPWVCTPEERTNAEAIEIIKELAVSIGCKWITTEATAHDKAVALISHLPVLVSAALLKTVSMEKDESILNLAKSISSSGFEDATRIGGGNPALGVSMMKNNYQAIIESIDSYREAIKLLEETIISKKWSSLKEELEKTKLIRPDFLN
tara:strand:+ start:24852 stop:25715 length:864 start_codon:yes stop_codon:yes gene_type:complete